MTLSVLHVGLESLEVRVGGLNTYCTNLVESLRENGVNATATWVGGSERYATPLPTGNLVNRMLAVARAIRASEAEVIDVHFAAHAFLAVATGALRHRPLVVHFQGPWAEESRWTGDGGILVRVKRQIERYVLRRADRVVTLSHAFARVAITNYFVRPERIVVAAPGVELGRGEPRDTARNKLQIEPSAKLLVAVRRLVPRMGLETLIRAMTKMPDVSLVIIGEGPERRLLEELSVSLGVADRVQLVGRVSQDLRDTWLSAASVSVVPTLAHEGYGLVVLESLAVGTPVVVSDVDGLLDASEVSSFVTTFRAGEEPALVAAIESALALSCSQSEVARDVEHLAWPLVAHHFQSLYGDLLVRVQEPEGVLVLDHTARLSGGELALGRTAEAIKQRGNYIPHVILFESGPFEAELRRRGITSEVLAMNERTQSRRRGDLASGLFVSVWETLTFSWRLRRVTRRRGARIIHTNSLKAFVIGSLVSLMMPWRLVAHVRDMWDEPYLSRRTSGLLRLLLASRSDGVIANSEATAHAASSDAVVIHSPVDRAFFALAEPIPLETLRIGVVGRIAPWKGQDLMLEALAHLDDRAISVTFVGGALFDEGEFEERLKTSAQRFGGRVKFLGAIDDVTEAMTQFDVTVLTSRSPEPFGNVVTEAMAAGRVVVVPRQGGVLDFVVDGENGLFYQPNDAESLAAVIRQISEGRVDRQAIGTRARETAAHYGAPRVANLVESVYESVLK